MIKVTIIIPFWGVEQYIEECIKSILNQTYNNFEVLFIDDCSQDNSKAIVESYQKTDHRIKLISHECNTGQGGARNTGLTQAQGEYIWFIDSDDRIWEANSLENLLDCAESNNVDIVVFDFFRKRANNIEYRRGAQLQFQGLFDSKSSVERFTISNVSHVHNVWNKFYRKDFLIKYQCYFRERTNHQDSIQILWLFNASRIYYLAEPHYFYRLRENSTMTSRKNASSYEHICRMSDSYDDYYFERMDNSRNARVLTFAKKINLLLREGAAERCYWNSTLADREKIIEMCLKNIISSRLYCQMPREEIRDALYLFPENYLFIRVENEIINNNMIKTKQSIKTIFDLKNPFILNRIKNKTFKIIRSLFL